MLFEPNYFFIIIIIISHCPKWRNKFSLVFVIDLVELLDRWVSFIQTKISWKTWPDLMLNFWLFKWRWCCLKSSFLTGWPTQLRPRCQGDRSRSLQCYWWKSWISTSRVQLTTFLAFALVSARIVSDQ